MIYLDNSATTQVDSRVLEEMLPYLQEEYGNPSSKYYTLAINAKAAIDNSRRQVATLVNCNPDEIIFTSCASESNNFIIKGVVESYNRTGNHIITSSIEHKSVLETYRYLESKGFEVTYLEVDKYGRVFPEDLEQYITNKTILVSIMWGNNEVGTLNKIEEIGRICKNHGVLFHSDATQVLGKVKINLQKIHVDFLSFSAHKIYGPKGIGGCYIKKDELGLRRNITPLIHGGGQEFDYRSGTLCTHNIVGFGKASEIAYQEMDIYIPQLIKAENSLRLNLKNFFPNVIYNGHPTDKIPGVFSITLPGINNELLLRKLHDKVAISTGSACSLNNPSYVLKHLGLNQNEIRNTIRISIGKFNTDIDCIPILIKEATE